MVFEAMAELINLVLIFSISDYMFNGFGLIINPAVSTVGIFLCTLFCNFKNLHTFTVAIKQPLFFQLYPQSDIYCFIKLTPPPFLYGGAFFK